MPHAYITLVETAFCVQSPVFLREWFLAQQLAVNVAHERGLGESIRRAAAERVARRIRLPTGNDIEGEN